MLLLKKTLKKKWLFHQSISVANWKSGLCQHALGVQLLVHVAIGSEAQTEGDKTTTEIGMRDTTH